MPPPGGPEDKSPPKIIRTIPSDREINVPLDSKIEILFDEAVKESEGSVVLLPFVDGTRVKFKGKRIVLDTEKQLEPNTTYRVSISTKLQDLRGNSLKSSRAFAFSTGSFLDSFSVFGSVYSKDLSPCEKATVALYLVNDVAIDTVPNRPFAVAWTGVGGRFEIDYLPDSKYLIVPFLDNNLDMKISATEPRAIPSEIIHGPGKIHWSFVICEWDSIAPQILFARAENPYVIRIKFDEPIVLSDKCKFKKSPENGAFEVFRYFNSKQEIGLFFQDELKAGVARIEVYSIADERGNVSDSLTYSFDIPEVFKDTVLSIGVIEKRKLMPNEPLFIKCSKPILDGCISVFDSLGKKYEGATSVIPPDILTYKPVGRYPRRGDLFWRLDSLVIADGKIFFDTTSHNIQIESESEIGKVITHFTGDCEAICDLFPFDKNGNIYRIEKKDGVFESEFVKAGFYNMRLFCDEDRDYAWFPGNLNPFMFSEKTIVYPDTVKVRGLWTTEIILTR